MLEPSPFSARSRGLPASKPSASVSVRLCQICGSRDLIAGLDLGLQPVADLILTNEQLEAPETYYPLQLFHCTDCGLCQLGYVVDPAVVYRDFPFVSGTTRTAREFLQGLARQMAERLGLGPGTFAVDIGSNDGTLLEGYAGSGARVLGIDPAAFPVRIAQERGIPTWHAFFNEETAAAMKAGFGMADAITATGCFGHIADLDGLMRGVKLLLRPGGLFVSDNQYWLDMAQQMHYDNIFHEHLRNYSLRPLVRLFERYGMEVTDVERSGMYGGSFRVFTGNRGEHRVSDRVAALLEEEEAAGLYERRTWERFAAAADGKRRALFQAVWERVQAGQKVIGIGAPAKAATVCNYCGLDARMVEYVTEVNPLRTGKYLPGARIPIVEERRMFEDGRAADSGILFAWNYYDEIVPKLRARGFGGEVLTP